MKRSLGTILVLFLIVGLAACSATKGQITGRDADPAAVPDLAGEYAVNGTDGSGSEYGGRLSIRPGDAAGHYRLQWIVNESIQEGAGAVEGNKLTATWQSAPGQSAQTLPRCRHVHHHRQGRALRHAHGGWGCRKLGREGVSEQEEVDPGAIRSRGLGWLHHPNPLSQNNPLIPPQAKGSPTPAARSPMGCAPSATRDSATGRRIGRARRPG